MKGNIICKLVIFTIILSGFLCINESAVYGAKKTSISKKATVVYGAKKTIKLKNNKKKVQWKVKNKKIIKIVKKSKKSVTLKGIKSGKTVIYAKIGKKKYSCKVTVKFKNATQRVSSYKYKITPLLAPFDEYFYVQTDNPNVEDIRFIDKSSKYYSDNKKGYVTPTEDRYYDVRYEKKKTGRVKGGYIFTAYGQNTDGGTLVLQVYNKKKGSYQDTKVKVSCKAVKSAAQYLVDNYTKSSMTFFEKMDAIQSQMDKIAIYPRTLLNSSQKNKYTPYPFLTTSPYKELWLNTYYRMYAYTDDRLFASDLYPFVLDSLSFPDTLRETAKIMAPSCTVRQGENHYEINVTYKGTTKTYGGDGAGESNPIYTSDVKVNYLFNNSSGDIAKKVTLSSMKATLESYGKAADKHIASYKSVMEGKAFLNKLGTGSWLRVGVEPFYRIRKPDTCYTYVSYDCVAKEAYYVEDAWVDGRYINQNNQFCQGEKFANRPEADIIVQNQTYSTMQGYERTGDLYYFYMGEDKWCAIYNYLDGDISLISKLEYIPSQFILTRSQVEKMKVDKNTNTVPKSGFIYDGSVAPGTAFKN